MTSPSGILHALLAMILGTIAVAAQSMSPETLSWLFTDGDSDQVFIVTSAVYLKAVQAGRMPEVDVDSDGKPRNLAWVERPIIRTSVNAAVHR